VNRAHVTLKSLNCDGRYGIALAAVWLALLALTLPDQGWQDLLRYDRAGLARGEYWRLVTAHLVHLDLRHACLNGVGLTLMWALFARSYSPRQWLLILVAAVAAIDLGLWLADSTVLWYVGSSGVLHGVMAAGALAHIRRGEPDGWILAVVLVVKLMYEHWLGALPLSGHDPVVVDAHLFGVAGAFIAAAFLRPKGRPVIISRA
jgi:rhomboid family GlyGly-CTERM serine protease